MTDGPTNRGFVLHLRRSGRTVPVAPDESALAALLRAGIEVPWTCRFGTCGSCVTRVLAGEPEHHDQVLSPALREAGFMALCVSRARSPELTLDL